MDDIPAPIECYAHDMGTDTVLQAGLSGACESVVVVRMNMRASFALAEPWKELWHMATE